VDQGDERRSLRPYLISAEKISEAVKAKPLQLCGLAAIIRQTASKGVVRISTAAGSDARYFAVLLRA